MEQEFIIHTMDMPAKMKKKFELSSMIKVYAKSAKISQYQKTINLKHAGLLNQFAWSEFNFEGLGTDYEDKMSYSHRIDADIKRSRLSFVRNKTEEPSIYDKIKLSINPH